MVPKKKPAKKISGTAPGKKRAAPKKKPAASAYGEEAGRVVAFFRIPVVAVIKVTHGSLKTGDRLWLKGHTTDLKQILTSMQIDHQPVLEAKKGAEVGVQVSARARIGDRVYRIALEKRTT
jgi:translation initiation factor IF-2